ncbi:MAG: hypothetical protein K6F44_06930 [Lachnospiraceae bacterium]|nr:hypothetical protein [Lachnospiraceae bacterium]
MFKVDPEQNAYVTVEAAFVFPFVICVIMAVIWLAFFMSGRIGAMCDSDRLLLQEERIYRDTGQINNTDFYRAARKTLAGYPLTSCMVSRCYGDYGEMVVEYVFGASLPGNAVTKELFTVFSGEKKLKRLKADNRITKARYIAVGKSIYTKVRGYARGWKNGSED